jgi:hypothetical protein
MAALARLMLIALSFEAAADGEQLFETDRAPSARYCRNYLICNGIDVSARFLKLVYYRRFRNPELSGEVKAAFSLRPALVSDPAHCASRAGVGRRFYFPSAA